MKKLRTFIKVEGIVQGVGFRPFVYNLAASLNLKGWVNNNSEGVYIDLEGKETSIESFLSELRKNPPPLARIEEIQMQEKPVLNYQDFTIRESERLVDSITLISPDIATCDDCINDIKDPDNRRYRYPFTNCTNCGPRFSIIKDIPYDRDKTTMKKFPMCPLCHSEYIDPRNRRFHAQPNACRSCGPEVWLTDSSGKLLVSEDPIKSAAELLKSGKILAIKGLSGFHLVCDAENSSAVQLLRQRKCRPHKPFAVMAKDLNIVKSYCEVNSVEEELLTGIRKPIVLLNRIGSYSLPDAVAPGQNTLGAMLPYTPIHHLLFEENLDILIMTSANITGLPLEFENTSAVAHLSPIVDYFLLHNRDIHIPVDDSVVKVVSNKARMIRRARGYAPDPVRYMINKNILACGPNMKNTFCISKGNFLFLSQHNGDLENLETLEHYERNIEHFKKIFNFKPKLICCDMHPDYGSTRYANDSSLPLIEIQHHHAHIVSCMVENKLDEEIIGVAFDGTGYGTDGCIWGGEFLLSKMDSFKRLAHLEYMPLPGGDTAVKEPWRIGAAYVYKVLQSSPALEETLLSLFGQKALSLLPVLRSNFNSINSSSMGRLFDAVSSILGIAHTITYEGQASIELESSINIITEEYYDFSIEKINGEYNIMLKEILLSIIKDNQNNIPKEMISAKFHNTIAEVSLAVCLLIKKDTCKSKVALSGGVFQNSYLLEKLIKKLTENNFEVYSQCEIPANDGGVALGQIAAAYAKVLK